MCDPVSIAVASFAVGTAGSIVSYQAQSRYAAQQEAAEQQRVAETQRYRYENAAAAQKAFAENAAQLRIRQTQEAVTRSEETQSIARERARATGTALASSRNAGLGLDAILRDIARDAGRATSGLQVQTTFDDQQTEMEITGARAATLDAINSVRPYIPQPVSRPSPLGLAVDIAGNAVSASDTYYRLQARQKGNP